MLISVNILLGYLTVTTKTFVDQHNNAKRPTLLLTWLPNSSLCKCTAMGNEEDIPIHSCGTANGSGVISQASSLSLNLQTHHNSQTNEKETTVKALSHLEDEASKEEESVRDMQELKNELQPLLGDSSSVPTLNDIEALLKKNPITSVNITISNPQIENTNIPQSYNCVVIADRDKMQLNSDGSVSDENNPNWMTPELLAFKHNLAFPDSANATPTVRRKAVIKCRRFSVDLSLMRSLRLFFNDDACTSGQLVIASRESQYKILHFHYGGLDHLAQVMLFLILTSKDLIIYF